jgi:uncharacterized membrane protein
MMYGRGYNLFNNCFGYGAGYINHGIGMFLMIGFILLAAMAFILFVTKINKRKSGNYALEALKVRLAKGEISEDEYYRRKNIID